MGELLPSDRPGEVTIVTLKRFECIDVMDIDEVEEEGIEEDDYFMTRNMQGILVDEEISIKSGFVSTMVVELLELQTIEKYGEHVLISKNPDFGSEEYCKDQAAEKERLDK